MGIWRSPDGYEVEAIILDGRQVLRVSRIYGDRRVVRGYCRDVAELAGLGVDLGALVEEPA
ncbi:transposase [Nonomuraea sp. NPDC050310]|uniref:transposase n=1 Tax=Nonomuraea sp. NPDC050310 TaxID=3154935 RepID=UPI0033C2B44E